MRPSAACCGGGAAASTCWRLHPQHKMSAATAAAESTMRFMFLAVSFLCGCNHMVRIDDELLGRALVEIAVTLGRLIEADHGDVYCLSDLDSIVKDRLHQLTVIAHHGALAGGEGMRLRPAQADADAQIAGS